MKKSFLFIFLTFSFLGLSFSSLSKTEKGSKFCSMIPSSSCKNLKGYLGSKEKGCAGIESNCREKFCTTNCLDSELIGNELLDVCNNDCDVLKMEKRSSNFCSISSSNNCKNFKDYLKAKREGCAGIESKCLQKFCLTQCFGEKIPAKGSPLFKVCRNDCDPEGVEKFPLYFRTQLGSIATNKFYKIYASPEQIISMETAAYYDKLRTKIGFCTTCYPSAQNNECKAADEIRNATLEIKEDHWRQCVKNCSHLKGFRQSAEQCLTRLTGKAPQVPMKPPSLHSSKFKPARPS